MSYFIEFVIPQEKMKSQIVKTVANAARQTPRRMKRNLSTQASSAAYNQQHSHTGGSTPFSPGAGTTGSTSSSYKSSYAKPSFWEENKTAITIAGIAGAGIIAYKAWGPSRQEKHSTTLQKEGDNLKREGENMKKAGDGLKDMKKP